MIVVLQAQLTDNLDEGLRQRADTIAAVLADAVPAGLAGDEDLLVQVVGRTARSSPPRRISAGVGADRTARAWRTRTIGDVPGRSEKFRVLTRAVETASGPAFLIVGDQLR